MASIITAEEAVRLQRGVETPEQQAVEILVERVDKAVRAACAHKCSSTTVTVPEGLWGVPTFNMDAVATQVAAFFQGKGFNVKGAPLGRLRLAWGPTSSGGEWGSEDERHRSFMAAPMGPSRPCESMIDEQCFRTASGEAESGGVGGLGTGAGAGAGSWTGSGTGPGAGSGVAGAAMATAAVAAAGHPSWGQSEVAAPLVSRSMSCSDQGGAGGLRVMRLT